MNYGSPFGKDWKKDAKKEEKPPKKVKCRVSGAMAKALLARRVNAFQCGWVERWLEQFCRENSYPLCIVAEGYDGLFRFFSPAKAEEVMARMRDEFERSFPLPQIPQSVPTHSTLRVSPPPSPSQSDAENPE